jgi:serine/threonine protein kinase
MISIEPYLLEKVIGNGSFGQVYYTSKKNSDLKFATKKIERSKVEKGTSKIYFLNEIDVLKNCDHENIIKLYEIKSSKNNYYMIMEYLERKFIRSIKKICFKK